MSETTVNIVIMIHIYNAQGTLRSEFACWPCGAQVSPQSKDMQHDAKSLVGVRESERVCLLSECNGLYDIH